MVWREKRPPCGIGLREVSKLLQEFFKEVFRVFHRRLSGCPRYLYRRFKGGSKVSKGVLRKFQGSFKDF